MNKLCPTKHVPFPVHKVIIRRTFPIPQGTPLCLMVNTTPHAEVTITSCSKIKDTPCARCPQPDGCQKVLETVTSGNSGITIRLMHVPPPCLTAHGSCQPL